MQCAYISAKIKVEMLTDLIVHAHIKDYGYGKKEEDNKYGKKEEYKKVGTCKMEQHQLSLIEKMGCCDQRPLN